MGEEYIAGMGQYVVAHNPAVLVGISLGSCIGAAVYDKVARIGGLAHVMLPSSKECLRKSENMNRFADVAIPAMIEEMKSKGCRTQNMVAKIVGGAHMFPGLLDKDVMDIGKRNEEETRGMLYKLGIRIIASETGGNIGRTVRFDVSNGIISVKTKDMVTYM